MKRCHRCGHEWAAEKRQPAVKETCEQCNAYLHCCLNCRFREPGRPNECQIPNTEGIGDRAGCNFCDEFEFADADAAAGGDAKKGQARDAFGQLFDGEGEQGAEEGQDAFGKLFGD